MPYLSAYYAALYRKIVSYVLLRSGLGSPTDIAIVREATGENRVNPCGAEDFLALKRYSH